MEGGNLLFMTVHVDFSWNLSSNVRLDESHHRNVGRQVHMRNVPTIVLMKGMQCMNACLHGIYILYILTQKCTGKTLGLASY